MSWEEISDILTPEGIKKLKVGNVLTFDFEGSKTTLKIMKVPGNGNVWAKQVYLVSEEDMNAHYGHKVDASQKTIQEQGGIWCNSCGKLVAS
jgi:hypothetical protein